MKELLFSSSIESMTEIESFEQELSFNQLKQLYILEIRVKELNATF